MSRIDAGVVSVGVLITVSLSTGVWKAGTLRSEIVERYQSRRDEALGTLEERSRALLRQLASDFSSMVGGLGAESPASNVQADPTEFRPLVNEISKTLESHARLPRYFSRMLIVGPILASLLSLAIVSIIIAFAYLSGWTHLRISSVYSLYTFATLLGFAVIVTTYYFVVLHLFENAELFATKDSRP
jgi:hypothetical protein